MVGVFQVRSDADAAYSGQYLYQGHENEPFAVRFGCYNPSLLRNHNYIDLNCFVHRRDILKKIGNGFCENIKRWVDWELILRIARVGKIYSVPILQSNYFIDKAENTITVTEELEPARRYIMDKLGYGSENWVRKSEHQLTKKVVVIVLVHGDLENIDAYIGTLVEQLRNPLVQFLVVGTTLGPAVACSLYEGEGVEVQSIVIESDGNDFYGIAQGMRTVDPDCDLMVLDSMAGCTASTLAILQKAAYACPSIGMTVPQIVLPGGEPTINLHVPYAFNDVPCDVALSNHHRNVEAVALLHDGGAIDLNYASLFCVYIKREVWDLCGGFDARQDNEELSDRNICDLVRHVLEKRIVYIPNAIVLHGISS